MSLSPSKLDMPRGRVDERVMGAKVGMFGDFWGLRGSRFRKFKSLS